MGRTAAARREPQRPDLHPRRRLRHPLPHPGRRLRCRTTATAPPAAWRSSTTTSTTTATTPAGPAAAARASRPATCATASSKATRSTTTVTPPSASAARGYLASNLTIRRNDDPLQRPRRHQRRRHQHGHRVQLHPRPVPHLDAPGRPAVLSRPTLHLPLQHHGRLHAVGVRRHERRSTPQPFVNLQVYGNVFYDTLTGAASRAPAPLSSSTAGLQPGQQVPEHVRAQQHVPVPGRRQKADPSCRVPRACR